MKQILCKKRIVLFGELLMRLQTKGYQRIVQAREFDVYYSGAEANLGVALGAFGIDCHLVSSVPPNEVGQACLQYLRQYRLNLDRVRVNGHRLGIYFVETGASQRPSTFLYCRKGSSITELEPKDFDWHEILAGKHWFHFTAITPALGDNVAAITRDACVAASQQGLTVSCDLNFRKKLWSKQKAREVMTELMEYVDILFTNEEEVETVFGIQAEGTNVKSGKLNHHGYEDVAMKLSRQFKLQYVSFSLRRSISATVNDWSGALFDGKRFYTSRTYHLDHIVDRVGGGDAYASGIIYGLLTGQDLQETVEFAAAASCLKHTIPGDFNLATFDEVMALMHGDGSGRIQR